MPSIKVKQHDSRDCGPACLVSIGRHFGMAWPIARLRQWAGTDQYGTNVLGLIEAAKKMGLTARAVRCVEGQLTATDLPAIVHLVFKTRNYHHYMVLYGYKKNGVFLMDPAVGRIIHWSKTQFLENWSGITVLFRDTGMGAAGPSPLSHRQRLMQLIKPHRMSLVMALAATILYTFLGLAMAVFVQKITDEVLLEGQLGLLNILGIIMVVVLLSQAFFGILKSILVLKNGKAIDLKLVMSYFDHLLQLPQQFFDRMQLGEILSRISDAVKIRILINDLLLEILVCSLIVAGSFSLMFVTSLKMLLVILPILPLYLLIYYLVDGFNKKVERRLMEQSAQVESILVESISQIRTLRVFQIEKTKSEQVKSSFNAMLESVYKSGYNDMFGKTSSQLLAFTFTLVVFWAGSPLVLEGSLSAGELFSFYALLTYFTSPLSSLVHMNKLVQNGKIAADRLFEIMDLDVVDSTGNCKIHPDQCGDISLKNVCFKYGNRGEVFSDLSACLKKGEITALVGPSGCGKSTLLALLQRLYSISSGRILIGRINLERICQKSWSQLVAMVPQQLELFNGSIAQNIALGDPEPNFQKISELVLALELQSLVDRLPGGIHSQIGENGLVLSGGQRQKIAIARALYRDPEILLLDEATSALDPETDRLIWKLLIELRDRGKTIITASHRLRSASQADRVLLLRDGRIAESGKHHELIKEHGLYKTMWEFQDI